MTASNRWLFRAICIGHFTIDLFNAMGPVLLAFISGHVMGLSNTQIGIAVSGYQMAGAFSQPFFGFRADKSGGRWLGAGGITWTLSFLVLAMFGATTGQYWAMLVPYVLAALGSGAFHPIGAMYASEMSSARPAHYTSIFFLSGQLGGGLGPLLIGLLLDQFATRNNLFTAALGPSVQNQLLEHGTLSPVVALALIALPGILLLLLSMPSRLAYLQTRHHAAGESRKTAPVAASVIVYLAVVIALRALANPGTAAFIPRIFQLKGWAASEYGALTGMYWFAGGIAGVIFARMASRFSDRFIIGMTLILGGPALMLLPTAETVPAALLLALLVGALTGGGHSLLVVMAQQIMPARKGLVSGLSLGFMFGMGALGTLLIGAMSDRIGLEAAFQVVGAITIITGLMALRLPVEAALQARKLAESAPIRPTLEPSG